MWNTNPNIFITSYHTCSVLITPYHTLSPRWERNYFQFATLKLVPMPQSFYHILWRLVTPYRTLPPWLEKKPFSFGNFKISSQDNVFITFCSNEFLSEVLPVASTWKVSNEGKKLLVVGPPDSGKTSWFAPFQGILTNTDLLRSSEKVTAIIFPGILFTKNLYHMKASQLICFANQFSGF